MQKILFFGFIKYEKTVPTYNFVISKINHCDLDLYLKFVIVSLEETLSSRTLIRPVKALNGEH